MLVVCCCCLFMVVSFVLSAVMSDFRVLIGVIVLLSLSFRFFDANRDSNRDSISDSLDLHDSFDPSLGHRDFA